jgi:hypothetical protein
LENFGKKNYFSFSFDNKEEEAVDK